MMRWFGMRKYAPLTLAVYDGLGWRASVYRWSRGQWRCFATTSDPSRHGKQLPKSILDFALKSGTRRLRVLLSNDVQPLSLAMPDDLTLEEQHTAIAHEASGELGLDANTQLLAAARSDLYDMGGDMHSLAVSAFDRLLIERFAEDAAREGLAFEGIGPLELALLWWHARHDPGQRLLLVRGTTAFYALPAGEIQPFLLSTLPLGLTAATDTNARERAERAKERLATHRELPLRVVIAGADSQPDIAWLMPLLGDPVAVETHALSELEPDALQLAVDCRVGGTTSPCAWVGLPPRPRDPHRHGTVIMVLIVLLTLGWVGRQYQSMQSRLYRDQARLAAWELLEQSRQSAKSESDRHRDRQAVLMSRQALLENRVPLPPGLIVTLDTLARDMPPYSRLTALSCREGNILEITGETRWQDGLSQLDEALRRALREIGMKREFGGIEAIDGTGAQRFRFRIMPGEDSR